MLKFVVVRLGYFSQPHFNIFTLHTNSIRYVFGVNKVAFHICPFGDKWNRAARSYLERNFVYFIIIHEITITVDYYFSRWRYFKDKRSQYLGRFKIGGCLVTKEKRLINGEARVICEYFEHAHI